MHVKIKAQVLRQPINAGYISMGSYSSKHTDPFSLIGNIAALAHQKHTTAGLYTERRFLLSAVNFVNSVLSVHTPKGNFSLQAEYFGFKSYRESQIGLGYSRSLGSKLDIGLKFNYFSLAIPQYGNISTVGFDLGFIAHLSENLNVGFDACNPIGARFFGSPGEKLRSVYTFGIGYDASDVFFVTTSIIKEEDMPVDVDAGIQYNYSKRFFIRAGIKTATSAAYAGAGYSWNMYRLDATASYHPQLGFSPGVMLIINFKENVLK